MLCVYIPLKKSCWRRCWDWIGLSWIGIGARRASYRPFQHRKLGEFDCGPPFFFNSQSSRDSDFGVGVQNCARLACFAYNILYYGENGLRKIFMLSVVSVNLLVEGQWLKFEAEFRVRYVKSTAWRWRWSLYILLPKIENLLQVTTERYRQSPTHRISQSIRDALLMLYPNFRYKPSRRIYFVILLSVRSFGLFEVQNAHK